MADYQKMYMELFCAVSKVVVLLEEAQRETEEIFISSGDTNITLMPMSAANSGEDGDQS